MPDRIWMYARRFAFVVLSAYAVVCALMFGLQRRLLFPTPGPTPFPEGWNVQTSAAGLPIAVFEGSPTVVYFHGNASSVGRLSHVQKQLSAQGFGLILPEYPGYAGSPGSPTEAGIFESARVAIAMSKEKPMCIGQSLGTGVASRMAHEGRCEKLVLLAPFTSIPDVAAISYPWLPVHALVRDRFDTASIAGEITTPTLILHGSLDTQVPTEMGRTLSTLFPHATLKIREGREHNDLWEEPIGAEIAKFVGANER